MAKDMKSLVVTTLNEEAGILGFLDSVSKQSVLLDEVVVVDGGSGDKTVSLIREFAREENRFVVKVIVRKGVNRSVGRNLAIEEARGEIILVSDAGCELAVDWVKEMLKGFDRGGSVVAGGYRLADGVGFWGKLAFELTSHAPCSEADTDFLASSRSVSFRKATWELAGGYPEVLNTAEDLVFARRLQLVGKQVSAPNAIVYWRPVDRFFEVLRVFYNYAFGDGLAGLESMHFRRYLIKIGIVLVVVWMCSKGFVELWFVSLAIAIYFGLRVGSLIRKIDIHMGGVHMIRVLGGYCVFVPLLFVVTLVGFVHGRLARLWGVMS